MLKLCLFLFVVVGIGIGNGVASEDENVTYLSQSLQVASLGNEIQNVCSGAFQNQSSQHLNTFVYGCFLNKTVENNTATIVEGMFIYIY